MLYVVGRKRVFARTYNTNGGIALVGIDAKALNFTVKIGIVLQ